jgi:hypothetical protein
VVGHVAGAPRRLEPGRVWHALGERAEVLQQEGHPAQSPVRQRAVRRSARLLELARHHRVQLAVELLDPLDRRVDQLTRRRLPARDQFRLRGGVHEGQRFAHAGRFLSLACQPGTSVRR